MRGFKLQMKKTGILLSVNIMSKNRQAQTVLNLNSLASGIGVGSGSVKLSLSSSSACTSHADFSKLFKFSEPNFTLIVHFSAYDPSGVPPCLP